MMGVGVFTPSDSCQLLHAFSTPAALTGTIAITVELESQNCLVSIDVQLNLDPGHFIVAFIVIEGYGVVPAVATLVYLGFLWERDSQEPEPFNLRAVGLEPLHC